ASALALVVRVAVVLAGAVVVVPGRAGVEGGQPLQPALVVLVQAGLVVVDEDRGRDVHGVDQAQALAHAAFGHHLLHLGGDVHEVHAGRNVHGEVHGVRLHASSPSPAQAARRASNTARAAWRLTPSRTEPQRTVRAAPPSR